MKLSVEKMSEYKVRIYIGARPYSVFQAIVRSFNLIIREAIKRY